MKINQISVSLIIPKEDIDTFTTGFVEEITFKSASKATELRKLLKRLTFPFTKVNEVTIKISCYLTYTPNNNWELWLEKYYLKKAFIAQWIEYWFPKPRIWVQVQ